MGILLAFISIQDLAVELRCVKTQARYVYSSILIHICGPMDGDKSSSVGLLNGSSSLETLNLQLVQSGKSVFDTGVSLILDKHFEDLFLEVQSP